MAYSPGRLGPQWTVAEFPQYSPAERRADAVVHAVGVTFGLAACTALAVTALPRASLPLLVGLGLYAAGLMAMLGCSALYNLSGEGARKRLLRRLDYAAIFSLGRYSESGIKGLLAKPEDRTAPVTKLVEKAGSKLIAFYMLFGEYDWVLIYEAPSGTEAAATILTAVGAGAVTDTRTMLAMTGAEAKAAFEASGAVAADYRAPGGS